MRPRSNRSKSLHTENCAASFQIFSQHGEDQQSETCKTEEERPVVGGRRRRFQSVEELIERKEQECRAEGDEEGIGAFLPKAQKKHSRSEEAHSVHAIKELIHGLLLNEFPNKTDEQGRYGEERCKKARQGKIDGRQYDEIENDEKVVDGKQHEASRRPQEHSTLISPVASNEQQAAR